MTTDPALTVRSHQAAPLMVFWEIASPDLSRVEIEIVRLSSSAGVVEAAWHEPWREFVDGARRWRCTGYTREE